VVHDMQCLSSDLAAGQEHPSYTSKSKQL